MNEPSAPDVVIHYCRTCGFGVPAEEIAVAVRRELGLSVECRSSWWGCFRIEAAGKELFNRWKSRGWISRLGFGYTPKPPEIVAKLRALGLRKS